MKPVSLMIQVNDYRNGMYVGRCGGVQISDFLHLDPRVLPEPRCTLNLKARTFSIHRQSVPILSHGMWVGNWCWDEISVDAEDAALLISACINEKLDGAKPGIVWVWGFEEAQGDAGIALADAREMGIEITPTRVLDAIYENMLEAAR